MVKKNHRPIVFNIYTKLHPPRAITLKKYVHDLHLRSMIRKAKFKV